MFKFGIDLERHRKSSTKPDGSFKCLCGFCGKLNCNFEMLGAHIQADCTGIRSRPTNEFLCEKCGKRFLSKDDMMSHLDTHTNYKSRTKRAAKLPEVFECDVCHSKFTLRKNYMRHKKLVYDDTESPRNIC